MARATLSIVKDMLYDHLSVRTGSYGTLDTGNQRYLDDYMLDNIKEADLEIINILIKNKQHHLLTDLYNSQNAIVDGTAITNSWAITEVTIDGQKAVEVTAGFLEELRLGGIYDTSGNSKYYALDNGRIYHLGLAAQINYIDVTHPTTVSALLAPTGFEGPLARLAAYKCLIKRNDKPEEAKMHLQSFMSFMSTFMAPSSNHQNEVDTE